MLPIDIDVDIDTVAAVLCVVGAVVVASMLAVFHPVYGGLALVLTFLLCVCSCCCPCLTCVCRKGCVAIAPASAVAAITALAAAVGLLIENADCGLPPDGYDHVSCRDANIGVGVAAAFASASIGAQLVAARRRCGDSE